MYYPKQIPYLLDKEFKKNIQYKEYRIREIENHCMCIWYMQSKGVLRQKVYNYILPDACVDLIIDFIDKSIYFAGFSKETMPFELHKRIDYMGVRFKPSSFYFLFGIEAYKIMDHSIPFSEVDKMGSIGKILTLSDITTRLNIIKNYLLNKIKDKLDNKFIEIVEQLYKSPLDKNVVSIAHKFGYNQRQLYRIFKINYGVSPKVLLNILRLHLCLSLMLDENMNLIEIANLCGFYDQSHFIKEIKRYTGISPLKLIEKCR